MPHMWVNHWSSMIIDGHRLHLRGPPIFYAWQGHLYLPYSDFLSLYLVWVCPLVAHLFISGLLKRRMPPHLAGHTQQLGKKGWARSALSIFLECAENCRT